MSTVSKRLPDFVDKEANISVWRNTTTKGSEILNIADNSESKPKYIGLSANVSGHILSGDEAVALYKGFDIDATMQSRAGAEYKGTICNLGVAETEATITNPDNPRHGEKTVNRYLNTGIARHIQNSEGKHTGYSIRPRGEEQSISFPRFVGGEEILASHCFALLNKEEVTLDNGSVLKDGGIETVEKGDKTYLNFKVDVIRSEESIAARAESREKRAEAETEVINGKAVRTFERNGEAYAFRVTEGGVDSADKGVSIRVNEIEGVMLSKANVIDLFDGKTIEVDEHEITLTGTEQKPSTSGDRVFLNAELDVQKISQKV